MYSPSVFLTTTPTLSQSGSVPIIMSAPSFFAFSIAILKTSFSSGFGYFTVEKLGSGNSCSFITSTFLNPTSLSTVLIGTFPVPCIGVKNIFISFPTLSIISCLRTWVLTASTNALSTSSPITFNNPFSIASFLLIVGIVLYSFTSLTSLIISEAIAGHTCPPSVQYTLYPLYSGGLWLAVITTPAVHPKYLTAKDNSGVGLKLSNIYAFIPQAAKVLAVSRQNSADLCLLSYAITTPFDLPSSPHFCNM